VCRRWTRAVRTGFTFSLASEIVVLVTVGDDGGVDVVVCSLTLVRVTGGVPQPASMAVPASNIALIVSRNGELAMIIVSLLKG
jgi:hypothetical protein